MSISRLMQQAASSVGGGFGGLDSFETFSGGVPDGWTVNTNNVDNGGIVQSSSVGVTEGNSSLGFVGNGTYDIAGESINITKDFDLTDFSQISIDFTNIKTDGVLNIQFGVTTDNDPDFISFSTGTKTYDVSSLTGVHTVELSIITPTTDGKTSEPYDFEIYWDNLIGT